MNPIKLVTDKKSDAAVEAKGLSYSYGDHVALRQVNFTAMPNQVHCFLGPNGSGKSTLFKLLATILPMQEGEVQVLNLDLAADKAEIRKSIGIVFQSPALDKKLTVQQNLTYGGHLYGLKGEELRQSVAEMLQHTGLEERAKDQVGKLSGGLKRRVELAKGLLAKPKLVLLDEPSTGLDLGARKDLWQFLRSRQDLTILLTTHLMEEAELADQITILHEGAVVAQGTPKQLKDSVGGEVLELECSNPQELASDIKTRFGVEPTIVDNSLRMQSENMHQIVSELMESFASRVERLTLSPPSLEDVYIQKTGHKFWTDKTDNADQPAKKGKAGKKGKKGNKKGEVS